MATRSRKTPAAPSVTTLSRAGVRALLTSGMIDGCPPGIANRLVDLFAENTLSAIESRHPSAVSYLGARLEKVREAVLAVQDDGPLLAWMAEKGATPGFAMRAMRFRTDPDNPAGKSSEDYFAAVHRNPYLLAQAPGIGFGMADGFALKIGFDPVGDPRLIACAEAAVVAACDDAGGGATRGQVLRTLQGYVAGRDAVASGQVASLVNRSFDLGIAREVLKQGRNEQGDLVVFSKAFHEAEEKCAVHLLRLSEDVSPYASLDLDAALAKAQDEVKLTLRAQQRDAIQVLTRGRVAIIAGKPGAGKTTLLKCVAPFLESNGKVVFYAAPTGKAAKRMTQAMARPSTTIHRLLGLGKRKADIEDMKNKLRSASAIVLDEASMVDVQLLAHVLDALGPKTLLLLVGDPGQLASVGPGKALADLIQSRAFPTAMLTQVHRQAGDSAIVSVSRSIDEGVVPDFQLRQDSSPEQRAADCLFLDNPKDENAGPRMVNLLRNAQQKGIDPLRDAQVIAASRNGAAGVNELNRVLQEAFNPATPTTPEFTVSKRVKGMDQSFTLRLGDKVIQGSNDADHDLYLSLPELPDQSKPAKAKKARGKASKAILDTPGAGPDGAVAPAAPVMDEDGRTPLIPNGSPRGETASPLPEIKGVFNGDVGFIERIEQDGTTWVKFDDGYASFGVDDARKTLTHAYANTVHKFQGSEAPLILFSLPRGTPMPLRNRNLVYTAITRAKKKCLVLGDFEVLKHAVRVDALAGRVTRLKGLINGAILPENLPEDVHRIYERKALRLTAEKTGQDLVQEAVALGLNEDEAQAVAKPAARGRRRL